MHLIYILFIFPSFYFLIFNFLFKWDIDYCLLNKFTSLFIHLFISIILIFLSISGCAQDDERLWYVRTNLSIFSLFYFFQFFVGIFPYILSYFYFIYEINLIYCRVQIEYFTLSFILYKLIN